MPYRVDLDRSSLLFFRKSEAEEFVGNLGACLGGIVSEAQILGTPWTSVKDSLPCKSDDVLLFNGSDREIYLNFERDYFEEHYKDVTHWMLLPDMPL